MAREQFHTELKSLEQEILRMGTLVEEQIARAVDSLTTRDLKVAQQVIADDDRVDDLEMEIERRCLTLLALQQPMAGDLRVVSTALKIITDLERMADHAADIANVTRRLGHEPLIKPLVDIPRMATVAAHMVRSALNAYIARDVEMARDMIRMDDEVDRLYGQIFRELLDIMRQDPDSVFQATYLLFVANYLERIADHATNLGEWVQYMVTGRRKERRGAPA
ncbi:MAG: phosphate signaling complex protein PhoU [Actinomycetia bacterium]|nr:phosphate signaling complex protein PhoU [Actinomycetes bacterium]